jgi:hypothetical protein
MLTSMKPLLPTAALIVGLGATTLAAFTPATAFA